MLNAFLAKTARSAPLKNSASALIGNAVNILVKFIARRVFVEVLGVEFLGLNGILANVISVLGIAELGISSAIIFSLYEPLKNQRTEAVQALLRFYRKAYNLIALITVVIGVAVMPFLHLIVREPIEGVNMYVAYLLALAGTVASYLWTYRQSILYAAEQGRTITRWQTASEIVLAELQILILLTTENYYIYLVATPLIYLARNLLLHKLAGYLFPLTREKKVAKLDKAAEQEIFKKIRALFIHKVSTFVIFGTDNIIISAFINVVTVGLYSNYQMIFSAVKTVLSQALRALMPTVGILLVDKDTEKNYAAFQKIRNIVFAVAMGSSAGILVLADPFVRLWVGTEYLLPTATLVVLTAVHFQTTMRFCFSVFKEAAGIFSEDKWVPVVESLINIVTSVVLVQWLGLTGVFVGTLLSSLALWCYSYPKYVYRRLFGRSGWQYTLGVLVGTALFVGMVIVIVTLREMW